MFNWLKPKPAPGPASDPAPACPANPGRRTWISIALDDGNKKWTERIDLVELLAGALRTGGYAVSTEESKLRLDCGLVARPGVVELEFRDDGHFQSCTTVEFSHPEAIPTPAFEFQHASGRNLAEAVTNGFNEWMTGDLQTILDALRPKVSQCASAELAFPGEGGAPGRKRRVVFGPAGHLASRPADGPPEEHPFCHCCLFNQNLGAFRSLIEDDRFFALRLFAARSGDGSAGADCRVNGVEFAPGKAGLMDYVKTWPDRGIEFRKQYVIIQNTPAG